MFKFKCLDAFTLKIIAIAAMTVDHVGFLFFPNIILLRVVGRLTFPIMGFFIAQGFYHTGNIRKYASRLTLFALISAWPCYLAFGWTLNIFFTLLAGLASLFAAEKLNSPVRRFLCVLFISLLTLPFDWGFGGVWLIYIMGRAKYAPAGIIGGVLAGMVLCPLPDILLSFFYYHTPFLWTAQFFRLGITGAVPLLLCYSQKRGRPLKYFFYWYYPVHLAILACIGAIAA